ncbi:Pentatricopeptide repeat-containing protein At5g16640 [Durusdinium trenchii]|uniref:Mitochondrial n=1 Tax=Durusdinium trenchii TaxID=1381693 RepID=A0ABP0NLJ5_9DINO
MLAQMEKVQLKANNIVCNSMLSTCAQSRQWQLALWLLSSFPKADVVSFNSTISACRGRTSIAMELLAAMEGRALQPSLVTLNSSICACSASDWPLALELLWQTKEVTSQRADDVTFSAVMSTCDRGSHWPRALEIFKVAPQEAAAGQMEFDEDWSPVPLPSPHVPKELNGNWHWNCSSAVPSLEAVALP